MSPTLPVNPDLQAQSASLNTPTTTLVANKKEPEADTSEADLLELAQERFRIAQSYESKWRERAIEELQFVDALEHWTTEQKQERQGLPCMVVDRIGPSIDQVVNDARQNPPEPRISPTGKGATEEEAEILQGLIRNVGQDSHANIAVMTGYEHAVKIGRGWWRVHFEYEADDVSPEAFQQKIVIKRIPNPLSVYPDPAADEYDYSDMRWCFVTEDLDRTVFEEMYPDALPETMSFQGTGDPIKMQWYPQGSVRVAEYWWVTFTRDTIVLMPDGTVLKKSEAPKDIVPVATRVIEYRQVHSAKITGSQVLSRTNDYPGKWIPLIPVLGREIIVDSKRTLRGMIRPGMDANLRYDYMISKEAQAIGLAPISQWLVAAGQTEDWAGEWADANRKPFNVLHYKPVDNAGEPVPKPERINADVGVASITQAIAHADNDIKATMSTYDASLGNAGPESSGKAIMARQREGDNAHFNYHDNLSWSIWHTGRVMIDLIPHVYSEERAITITYPDGSVKNVMINQPTKWQGVDKMFRIGKKYNPARYDVTIGSGPSYASQKAQDRDSVIQLSQSMPILGARAADLVIRAVMPGKEGDELADRVRPPDVKQEQDENAPPIPPQVQQAMAQQGQMIQALTQELHKVSETIEKDRLKYESAERIAVLNAASRVLAAEVSSKSAEAQKLADLDHAGVMATLEHREELLHINQTLEQDAADTELANRQQDLAEQQAQQPPAAQPEGPAQPQAGG